jgi:hypothetical protein
VCLGGLYSSSRLFSLIRPFSFGYRGFPKTSVFGKATLKFAVLQGCRKVKSLKNRKSLQAP